MTPLRIPIEPDDCPIDSYIERSIHGRFEIGESTIRVHAVAQGDLHDELHPLVLQTLAVPGLDCWSHNNFDYVFEDVTAFAIYYSMYGLKIPFTSTQWREAVIAKDTFRTPESPQRLFDLDGAIGKECAMPYLWFSAYIVAASVYAEVPSGSLEQFRGNRYDKTLAIRPTKWERFMALFSPPKVAPWVVDQCKAAGLDGPRYIYGERQTYPKAIQELRDIEHRS